MSCFLLMDAMYKINYFYNIPLIKFSCKLLIQFISFGRMDYVIISFSYMYAC